MKQLFAVLVLIFLLYVPVSRSWGESRVFVEYPTLGECTGNNVRIRSEPDKNSEIVGKLDEYDKIIVLNKIKSGNDSWYEVDNPKSDGTAYVFGKYLVPAYKQKFQRSKAAKILTDMRLTYGSTSEKVLALSGETGEITRRKSETDFPLLIVDCGDFRALYWDTYEEKPGSLKSLEVKRGNKSFGNIRIGDSSDKLLRELGKPTNKTNSSWEYEIYLYGYDEGTVDELVDSCIFRFSIKDGKISKMYYYNHENGEDGEEKW